MMTMMMMMLMMMSAATTVLDESPGSPRVACGRRARHWPTQAAAGQVIHLSPVPSSIRALIRPLARSSGPNCGAYKVYLRRR
jgi:hypothetical protein